MVFLVIDGYCWYDGYVSFDGSVDVFFVVVEVDYVFCESWLVCVIVVVGKNDYYIFGL